jgi:ABC transport system ATP-binding/permease protein
MSVYLQIDNAAKNYGDIGLFENISFTIDEGDKVALVAKNGTGKTTLLNILAGKDTFDSGKYLFKKDIKISYLQQDPHFHPGHTLFETIYSAPGKLMEVVRDYESALHRNDQKVLEKAIAQMDFHQAWDLESRIRQILGILKLNDEDQRTETLSGGQVKRLALAVALLNEPDFLILDEPTNHLDLDMIEWLEEYLTKSRITLFMVTHDRYFLDRICNQIIEIDERDAYSYKGNYTLFLQKREERIVNKALNVEKARNLLRTELEWMRRMPKARNTKAKYRIDNYYNLKEQSEYRRNDRNIEISTGTSRLGKKILVLDRISKCFGDRIILDRFSYNFTKGEKLGIIGNNGTGKTTFLNLIAGLINPDKGKIEHGDTVIYGYYKQEGLNFKAGQKVIEVIQDIAEVVTMSDGKQLPVGQFLTTFLFPPEMQYVPVEKLSGGEKRRLYLLTILIKSPNFLILDEPTNDFDIVTLNVLDEYLKSFGGCLIIVSHDRFFMDKIVDHLFIFEGDGAIYDFPGNYSDYRSSQKIVESENRKANNPIKEKASEKPALDNNLPVRKKLSFKERLELNQLTSEIETLEKEKSGVEHSLNSGNLKADELIAMSNRMADLLKMIDQKTDRWIELSE